MSCVGLGLSKYAFLIPYPINKRADRPKPYIIVFTQYSPVKGEVTAFLSLSAQSFYKGNQVNIGFLGNFSLIYLNIADITAPTLMFTTGIEIPPHSNNTQLITCATKILANLINAFII
jgi:hypothetical protein